MTKAPIGDVHVTDSACENPYTYAGSMRSGRPRQLALQAFRDGVATPGMQLWHAPADGGAIRITAADVNWETM